MQGIEEPVNLTKRTGRKTYYRIRTISKINIYFVSKSKINEPRLVSKPALHRQRRDSRFLISFP